MKNIHVLPTDKSSRLSIKDGILILHRLQWRKGTQNIYITNDEEIKDGYYLDLTHNIIMKSVFYPSSDKNCKKIILTTDQDLIKDGVQAIDDEFLEWFVKNSSCEEVKVYKVYYDLFEFEKDNTIKKYIIIIPKEESKQTDWKDSTKALMVAYGDNPKDFPYEEPKQTVQEYEQQGLEKYSYELEPKQETIEEAIKKEYKFGISSHPFPNPVDIGGQEEKMYSEEEIMNMFHNLSMHLPLHYEFLVKEQFKKK